MKRWLTALVIVVLVCSAALSGETKGRKRPGAKGRESSPLQVAMMQLTRRYDANKNGRLDPDEQRALLTAADKNLDGRLSPEELMAAAQEGAKERGKEAGKKKEK